jgi:hypothetical protein
MSLRDSATLRHPRLSPPPPPPQVSPKHVDPPPTPPPPPPPPLPPVPHHPTSSGPIRASAPGSQDTPPLYTAYGTIVSRSYELLSHFLLLLLNNGSISWIFPTRLGPSKVHDPAILRWGDVISAERAPRRNL